MVSAYELADGLLKLFRREVRNASGTIRDEHKLILQ